MVAATSQGKSEDAESNYQARNFAISGLSVYLFIANILAQTGVVSLPLSYGTIGAQGFAIQITLLTLQLLVVLAMSVIVKRFGSTRPASKTDLVKVQNL